MFKSCANLYLTPNPKSAITRNPEISWPHPPDKDKVGLLAGGGMRRNTQKTSEICNVMTNKLLEILLCAEARRIYRLQRDEKRMKILDIHHIRTIG